jgi:type IV pilus assembly protein PilA
MASSFRHKLLLQIATLRPQPQGFTLLELLVVIIILGVLAAIALPAYLNQVQKGKQSEAKAYISTLNKGQKAYFTTKSTYGGSIDLLGVGVPAGTPNYTYSVSTNSSGNISDNYAIATATPKNATLRAYTSMVQAVQVPITMDVSQMEVICEMNSPGFTLVLPVNTATKPICPDGAQVLKHF